MLRSKWMHLLQFWLLGLGQFVVYLYFLIYLTLLGFDYLNTKDVTDINQPNDTDSSIYIHQLYDNRSEDNEQFTTFETNYYWSVRVFTGLGLFYEFVEVYFIGVRKYLTHVENIGSIVLYVLAIVVTSNLKLFDFEDISGTSLCETSECWKWPAWSLLLTATWINAIRFLKKIPGYEEYFGSYSVMVWEVTKPLLRITPIFLLIVWSLAIGVHIILFQQDTFKSLLWTFLKLFTMSTGELDYGSIFFPDDPIESPITFPATTVVLYLIILILGCVIMMNLAIGLAVNNIQEFQESAEFYRIKNQVEHIFSKRDPPKADITIPKTMNYRLHKSSFNGSLLVYNLLKYYIKYAWMKFVNIAIFAKYESESRVGNTEILERLEELENGIHTITNDVKFEFTIHSLRDDFQDISREFKNIAKEISSQKNKSEIDEIRSQQLQILTTLNEMKIANRNNDFKQKTDDETTLISKHSIKDGSNEAMTSLRDEIEDFKVEMKTLLRESIHLQRSTLLNQSDYELQSVNSDNIKFTFNNQNQATLSQNDFPTEDSILSPPKSEVAGNKEAIAALKDEIRDFKVEMKTFLRESISLQMSTLLSALHQSSDDLKSDKSDSVIFSFDTENQADISLVDGARKNSNVAQSGVFNQHDDKFSIISSDDCPSEYFPGEKI